MNILYTCDDNYIWLMGISMTSLFENNKKIKDLKIYLLGKDIREENKKILKEIANRYEREVIIIDVPEFDIPDCLLSSRWPISSFTRLFSAVLLPEDVEKILYLDCDTLIINDISELESLSFDGKIAIGVKDCISGIYKKNIGLGKSDLYINAGVILLDIKSLRKINIKKQIEDYMIKYKKRINYADQDILNGILNGKIGALNPKYNIMTIDVAQSYEEILELRRPTNFYNKIELEEAKLNPVIIHYTTNMTIIRPWFSNTNHPLLHQFRKYMMLSPWKNITLKKFYFTSREARVINILMKLPTKVAYPILGFIHAELKPRYIKLKAGK